MSSKMLIHFGALALSVQRDLTRTGEEFGSVSSGKISCTKLGGGPLTSGVAGIVLVGYMLRSMIPRKRGEHGGIVLAYAAGPESTNCTP